MDEQHRYTRAATLFQPPPGSSRVRSASGFVRVVLGSEENIAHRQNEQGFKHQISGVICSMSPSKPCEADLDYKQAVQIPPNKRLSLLCYSFLEIWRRYM